MSYSLETQKRAYQPDFPKLASAPTTSIYMGVWSKPIVPNTYPLQSPNHDIMVFGGRFWEVRCITDNTMGNTKVDETIQNFNQNSMFFGSKTSGGSLNWANDYTYYLNSGTITRAAYLDWKYNAWQIILDIPGSQITIRQWLKYGLTGTPVRTGLQTLTFATLRTALQTNAGWTAPEAAGWTPDNMDHIAFGDTSMDGTIWNNIIYGKAFNRSTEPSISEVDAYALNFNADVTAWGDWPLTYTTSPVLTDRSGNSRTLTTSGIINQGTLFTGDVPANDPYNPYGLDWSGRIF